MDNIREEDFARELVFQLTDWFEKNKRILPWRSNPTPYHVWVSEIMLQQTRVEAVKGFLCFRTLRLWQGRIWTYC